MPNDAADLDALGAFIREQRQCQGMTQAQLAERLGWTQERISVLENGKYGTPSLTGLAQLADVLAIPLAALLERAGFPIHDTASGDESPAQAREAIAFQYALQRLLEIDAMTVSDALNQASDLMAEAMAVDKIDAFMYDPTSNSLVALGTSNTPMGKLQHQSGLERVPVANRGPIVQAYEMGEVYCSGDVRDDPEISVGIKETLGVRSMLAVPLRVDGTIQGVLAAETSQLNHFTVDEQRFFQSAARWIGMVARRAELTESMRSSVAEEARRVAADEVITAVAHDLGNAMTPLKARLDVLRRTLERESRQRDLDHVQEAERSVRDMRRMVARLLDSARLDQGLFSLTSQTVDLSVLVDKVAEEMRATWKTIEVRSQEGVEVEGDPVRLRDVLLNLLTNATQHSPQGVPISIALEIRQRGDGRYAAVSVTDEGPGIAPHLLPRIFERFSSGGGTSGLGLGLYLSRRIVEAHGGTLTVKSAVDKGTTFTMELPAVGE